MTNNKTSILEVKNLKVEFKVQDGKVKAVNGLSFKIYDGEIVGIVGESGSGKSQTMLAVMGLLAGNGTTSGSVKFMGNELVGLSSSKLNKIRGDKIAMVFQDPMTSLNPYLKISSQMTEVLILHKKMSYKEALAESIKMLETVKIPDAKNRIHLYPHEFSGGMRQRVMIAMMLLTRPKLLIADEPTTALDVTVQAQILELLRDIRQEFGMSIIFITHDMGVVANLCDRVNVMYGGGLMETANINEIFENAQHPYTKALLDSIPSIDQEVDKLRTIPGEPPNLLQLPDGCPFQARCDKVSDKCQTDIPLQKISNRHIVKCTLELGSMI
ncbi:MAG: ATP-binding cassette domain-containing protein [Burkholderiales bacterium]|nr:ATP-binding cassette domain-containing protein [Burkholderiales bacterium]